MTFSNISKAILNYKVKSYTQQNYINDLFCDCIQLEEFLESDFEITKTNKWINGKAVIPVDVCDLYVGIDGVKLLKDVIEDKIVQNLLDFPMVMEKVTGLIRLDDTIHSKKKDELLLGTDFDVLAKAIQFAMLRDKEKKETGIAISVASRFSGVEVPTLSNVFLGRIAELEELHDSLRKSKSIFVTGIAGIGKSELVREYARKYRHQYSDIFYLTYENTLEYTIAHMHLKGEDYTESEKQLFESHYHILQGLDEKSLIIIDNYNTLPEENRLLRKFVNHRFRTIFTTRMNMKGFFSLEIKEIQDMDILLELFRTYYKYKPKEKETIVDIIQEVHSHTLTVELVARTLQAGSIRPDKLLEQLIVNGLQTQDEEEITITKDEEDRTAVMYQHIRMLFNLSSLNKCLTEVLMNLCLIPLVGLEKELFNAWCKRKNSNDINRLARLGWIIEDEEERKLYMHPMVQEIVKEEIVPSISKCSVLLDSIHDICLHFGIDVSYYQTLFSMIMSIIEKIKIDNMKFWIRFLEDALAYMDKYGDYTNMEITLRELEFILGSTGYGEKEDIALMLDYKAHMCFISNCIDKAIKRERQALKIIPEINQGNALLHSNLNANMGMYYLHKNKYSDAEVHMKLAIEILNNYDVSGYYDIIPQLENYGNLLIYRKMPDEALVYFEVSKKLISGSQGEESSDYGIILRNIGVAYAEMGDMDRALRYFSDSEKILVKVLPPDHPQIQLLQNYSSQIYKLKEKVLRIDRRIDMIEQNN